MARPKGAKKRQEIRFSFDRRLRVKFKAETVSSDGGLLLYRELDEHFGLGDIAQSVLKDTRTGTNLQYSLIGLLRQAIYSRLAGYEDVNDAERMAFDPVMRQIVGIRDIDGRCASTNAIKRFETEILSCPDNLAALDGLSGHHYVPTC